MAPRGRGAAGIVAGWWQQPARARVGSARRPANRLWRAPIPARTRHRESAWARPREFFRVTPAPQWAAPQVRRPLKGSTGPRDGGPALQGLGAGGGGRRAARRSRPRAPPAQPSPVRAAALSAPGAAPTPPARRAAQEINHWARSGYTQGGERRAAPRLFNAPKKVKRVAARAPAAASRTGRASARCGETREAPRCARRPALQLCSGGGSAEVPYAAAAGGWGAACVAWSAAGPWVAGAQRGAQGATPRRRRRSSNSLLLVQSRGAGAPGARARRTQRARAPGHRRTSRGRPRPTWPPGPRPAGRPRARQRRLLCGPRGPAYRETP
jgi:hypothetical protein